MNEQSEYTIWDFEGKAWDIAVKGLNSLLNDPIGEAQAELQRISKLFERSHDREGTYASPRIQRVIRILDLAKKKYQS